MADAPAEQSSPQWFAYTRLGQFGYSEQNWFSEKGFATQQDAETFLDGPAHDWPESASRSNNGWRGPIKLELLSSQGDCFTGPWLANALKDDDFDSEYPWERRFNDDFAACAADVVPRVMGRMEANGELPSEAPLTREHHRLVQRRLKKYELPEIECRLGADWDFGETEMNARLLAAHRTPNGALGYEHCLFGAALEIETLVRQQHHGRLRTCDISNLWTSFDVWVHLARFCRERLWVPGRPYGHRPDERLIEEARHRFCGRLGSYVVGLRSSPLRRHAIGSTMRQESSWEELSEKLKRISQGTEPLRADWFAYTGSEDYGIWLFHLDGRGAEDVRAALGLIAAQAIAKLGIPPIPIPQPLQHCPPWKDYCDEREEHARLEGRVADYSNAVPFGLGTADRDAVDPCTRAWLELLRRESTGFRSGGSGTFVVKGREYPTVTGSISDVCEASAIYCMRRARDEIGIRLISSLGQAEPTISDNRSNSPEPLMIGPQWPSPPPLDSSKLSLTENQGDRIEPNNLHRPPPSVPAQASSTPDATSIKPILLGKDIVQEERRDIPNMGPPDKGNLEILRGRDGKRAKNVNLDIASRFGGVSRRAIEKAIKKGSLHAEGERLNRRISVKSLLKYFPSENNTN